jgi:hypothetical protein
LFKRGRERLSNVFVADKLSEQNKAQAKQFNVHWIELHAPEGYKKFKTLLELLKIPHNDITGDLDTLLDTILQNIFLHGDTKDPALWL